ncbi:MAG: hypothetical protein JO218_11380 [Burkholderiales bacterium]|nr:hypothetical protein [Burkholderiales bacterium]
MFDQRTSGRRLVRWKAAIIPQNQPDKIIQGLATEVAQKGVSLFCKEQLFPHITYRIVLQIPDAMHISVSYVEVHGKPAYSSLVGSMGEFRTGVRLTDISNEYRNKLDQLLRGLG